MHTPLLSHDFSYPSHHSIQKNNYQIHFDISTLESCRDKTQTMIQETTMFKFGKDKTETAEQKPIMKAAANAYYQMIKKKLSLNINYE